jgi:hypothetical protein
MWKLVLAVVAGSAATAAAETLAVPTATPGVELPQGRVICGAPPEGWTTDAGHRVIRVPAKAAPGARADVRVAMTLAGCAQAAQSVAIEVTAPWPVIEHAVWHPDEGQLEIRGHHLAGLQVRARADKAALATCDLVDGGATETCHAALHELPAAGLVWLPAGASGASDEALFDADGHAVASGAPPLTIDRTELAMLIRPGAAIDAVAPDGSIPLRHADTIATVDCAPASCVVDGDALLVSSIPDGATSLAVRVRLAAHVVLRHGDASESSPVIRIPIVRCPLALASGAPVRGLDAQTVILKVGGKCAAQVSRMSFAIQGLAAERIRDYPGDDAAYVALRIGRTDAEALAISAVWEQGTEAIAQLRVATRAAPTIRISLELGHRSIDFIPTNALATAHVMATDWDGTAAVIPVENVYDVVHGDKIRGVASSGGLVALRVALREHLPAPIGDTQIGTLRDSVDRPIREASSFAPLLGEHPLVELVCDEGDGPVSLTPGSTAHVPFDRHDSCRMVLHRERLDPSLGAQRLMMEVEVTRVDGSPRAEARVAKRMKLTHDETPRTLWLRGAESRFDRYTVRLSQEDDEDRARDDELPSAQWTVVTGRGRARVYATSAIPTGLYRVSDHDHSGILTLNFGVLARATWLDSLGREGILCLEAGALTVGLANDTSATGKSLTQVAAVGGLGLSVPIANRALAAETSVNLHAWVEFEPSRAFGSGTGNAWAFVFGPSITVGNLGADL